MIHGTQEIFPVGVYVSVVDDATVQRIENQIGPHMDSIRQEISTYTWDAGIDTNFFEDPETRKRLRNTIIERELTEMQNMISHHLNLYADTKVCDLQDSWFNFSNHKSYQERHIHGEYPVSGVYYLQARGDGADGALVFHNPSRLVGYLNSGGGPLCSKEFKPSKGMITLFPGWLEHNVTVNKTHDERISLAFNLTPIYED
tara:strand:+ start:477 stop:1079 length:603 start_codon:yes stop_codon:yes gene_type:complete